MNPNFSAFIEPARRESSWYHVLLTLIVWFVLYVALSTAMLIVFSRGFRMSELGAGNFTTPASVYVLLLTFVIWIAVFWGVVRLFHKRGLDTMLGGPRRRFLQCFGLAVLIFGIFIVVTQSLFPTDDRIVENIAFERWLMLLPVGLMLMLIQVSAEEIVFRGYMQQQLAVWFNNRLVYMIIPSIIFGAMHYSSELGVGVGLKIVAVTGFLGLFLADLTYRTGNLGAAIGVHFANNFGAMFHTSYQEQISGLARYVAPDYFVQPELLGAAANTMLFSSAIMFSIYFGIMEWRARR